MTKYLPAKECRAGRRREGFVLHEAMMAVALAVAGLLGIAQLLGMTAQQRRLAQQRAVAIQEVGNLMERLACRNWNELVDDKLTSIDISASSRRSLPDAKVGVNVKDEDQNTKRISIEIGWRTTAGKPAEPARLVAWKFRDPEDQP